MRLGIFGGSFDPVHQGHVVLANCCLQQARLDSVWFVPASQQPLKPQGPRASDAHRLAMLQYVAESRPEFKVSAMELERRGVSYTVDTLAEIRAQQPQAELFFLMGADSLAELPKWHRAAEVCQLATPLIVHRAGEVEPDFDVLRSVISADQWELPRQCQVEMPATPISSTRIRELVATQGDWEEMVPLAVAEYIQKHNLYVDTR